MTYQISQVDLRLLRVFMAVVDSGGFIYAQEELNVSQSTLSCHMSELEERLGMRLCERGRSGFRVTNDGQMVYQAAQRLFNHIDEFNSDVRSNKGKLVGELQIACMDHIVMNQQLKLSDALGRFKDRNGNVNISLHIKSPPEVQHGVAEGVYHVGIGSPLKQSAGVEYIPLCTQRHQLFCAMTHPLFGEPDSEMKMSELSRWDMVRPKFRQAEVMPKRFRKLPSMTATGFNIEGIAMLVLSGRFIGFLPVNYAEQWVRKGEMRALWADEIEATVEIALVCKKQRSYKPQVEAFIRDVLHCHHIEDRSACA
jgi:DNA-binding transcriptional LysR family regulator